MKLINNLKRVLSKAVFVLIAGINALPLSAQQDPVYTQYLTNMLTIQPAYAGISGCLNITALSRQQWVGWEGAPRTNSLIAHMALNNFKVGLGFSIINDRWGPIRQNGVYVDYAYRVNTGAQNLLSLGLKAGFNTYQSSLSSVAHEDPNDPLFATDVPFRLLPNLGLGAMWYGENYFVGISIPKLLKNKIEDKSSGEVYAEVVHLYITAAYVFRVSDKVKCKPTILYRWSENTPSVIDFGLNMLISDCVWAGATYRLRNSYALTFRYTINSRLTFGYAYDLTSFHNSNINSNTHEFMVSYSLPKTFRREVVSPRYF